MRYSGIRGTDVRLTPPPRLAPSWRMRYSTVSLFNSANSRIDGRESPSAFLGMQLLEALRDRHRVEIRTIQRTDGKVIPPSSWATNWRRRYSTVSLSIRSNIHSLTAAWRACLVAFPTGAGATLLSVRGNSRYALWPFTAIWALLSN